ncbi:MAG TPA: DUF2142 domain-containing protein, partial [Acetobacteraceae bacterium]|nr:DUF2142 domain-containing protein [Acetobacteraceae bacterium]
MAPGPVLAAPGPSRRPDPARRARTLNGLAAVAIIVPLLQALPFGAATILLLLLLPKTLLHFASNSPDPLLHAAALGLVLLACRAAVREDRTPVWQWVLAGFTLFVTLGLRPPLIALDLVLLWAAWRRREWLGAALVLLGTALGVGWLLYLLPRIVDIGCGGNPSLVTASLAFLRQGPVLIGRSLVVHGVYYVKSFIGELGWGNGPQG